MNELVPLEMELSGHTLIEASAGTGKTYTITSLFLRLILEQGLEVSQILIVTFTKAATEDLKDRVRHRLKIALDHARGDACKDDFVASLLERSARLHGKKKIRILIERAIISLDEAAIFTIHGFCQRMLSDYAFETETSFDMELIPSHEDLLLEAARQFWRQEFYGADPWLAKAIISLFPGPGQMLQTLRPLLGLEPVMIEPKADLGKCLENKTVLDALFLELKTMWTNKRRQIVSLLEDDNSLVRRRAVLKKKGIIEAAKALDEFFEQEEIDLFSLWDLKQMPFSQRLLENCLKKGYSTPPCHPFFKKWDTLIETHDTWWTYMKAALLERASNKIRQICTGIKQRLGLFAFDDLLVKMDKALCSPNGPRLAAMLRKRFKVAMIDEFQDTDQVQYRIFEKIYPSSQHDLLIMIGDPKQSIYAFRGADIFTYLNARSKVGEERRFGLAKNWRSSPGLVEAVNFLFTRRKYPFVFEAIPYHEVKSRDPRLPFLQDPDLSGDLIIWKPDEDSKNNTSHASMNKSEARRVLSDGCAGEIARLLAGGAQGRILIKDPSGKSHPVRSSDIAILVRNRTQAEVMRNALSKAGISCVYHANQSVFSTDEAWEFLMVLRAAATPGDLSAVSTALATDAMGWNAKEIAALREHPEKWEDISSAFFELRSLWLRRGVLVMFRQMIHQLGIAHRLLQLPGGERRLTNWFQLAELLDEKRPEVSGIEAELSWLANQIELGGSDEEGQQMRLESDRQLVTIMTIHRSKGLEFPIVFVPFIWDSSSGANRQNLLQYFDEKQGCYVIRTDHGQMRSEMERQRLAEETRLLYVALTRAVVRCYISWGRFKSSENSALYYLLQGYEIEGPERCPASNITPIPGPVEKEIRTDDDTTLLYEVRQVTRRVRQRFGVESFSSLSMEEQGDDSLYHFQKGPEPLEGHGKDIFSFPRGALPGNCIHKILENVDFSHDDSEAILGKCRLALAEWGLDPTWDHVLLEMVENVTGTQILPDIRLKAIPPDQMVKEMEFSSFFSSIIDVPSSLRQALDRYESGIIRGFVDLLFAHDGLYYVADYKSNYLGDKLQDYRIEKLRQAMTIHDYHLQAEIYALALHRLLSKTMADYRFNQHFGGVVYLFVRGIHPSSNGKTGVLFIPREEIGKRLGLC